MNRYLTTAAIVYVVYVLTISLVLAEVPNSLSVPLKWTMQSCGNQSSRQETLTCALMMHDMLCYSSVMQSAMDVDDDRKQCLTEADNPVLADYLQSALVESKDKPEVQQQLKEIYRQWQQNIKNMQPQPLEPEYQYKLRRDRDQQQLFLK